MLLLKVTKCSPEKCSMRNIFNFHVPEVLRKSCFPLLFYNILNKISGLLNNELINQTCGCDKNQKNLNFLT